MIISHRLTISVRRPPASTREEEEEALSGNMSHWEPNQDSYKGLATRLSGGGAGNHTEITAQQMSQIVSHVNMAI